MSLLQMSFSGAVMILTIVMIRALVLHKIPKKTFLALWGVALVRLLIPYSVPSAFSVYSLAGRLTHAAIETKITPAPAISIRPSGITTHGAAAIALNPSAPAFDPWMAVWLAGTLACGTFFAAAYLKCRKEFQTSLPVDSDYVKSWLQTHRLRRVAAIRQSDRISAPLTYGVLRPVILMPKTTDWDNGDALAYVLEHEYVHIRRFDAAAKLALTAALCVHWFNPTVWIMYLLANRDIELSCDEAVLRRFGESAKAAYAMALIRMEETKGGLSPLCNNFSKNAIEERIVAIMKIKKTSLAALVAAIGLVAGVTTAFATSGQPEAAKENIHTVEQSVTLISYTDPKDGRTYYSQDGGKIWRPMAEGKLEDRLSSFNVEWWTPEEYETWLENEKKELQSIIGAQGWTQGTGWFTWTQEIVDQTIAMYEQTLKDIQNGVKISKPTDDGEDSMIMYGFCPELSQTDVEENDVFMDTQSAKLIADSEWFPDYEKYGLGYDEKQGVLLYDGQIVNFFHDETSPGVYTHISFNRGTVGIEVQRNADWKITGLVERSAPSSEAVTQEGVSEQTAYVTPSFDEGVYEPSQEELLEDYGAFGVSFDESGKMLYHNKLVRWFADFVEIEDGALATRYVYRNDEGTEYIHTVRGQIDNGDGSYDPFGPLTGIVPWETGSLDELGFLFQGSQINEASETGGGDRPGGTSFAERFAKYKAYGITYEEASGASGVGNVYWNGQLVSRFTDISPDGGAFSFTSVQQGGVAARTVYDGNGRLTGVEAVRG